MYGDEIDLRSLDLGSLTQGDWEALMRHATRRARAERARVVTKMLRRLFGTPARSAPLEESAPASAELGSVG